MNRSGACSAPDWLGRFMDIKRVLSWSSIPTVLACKGSSLPNAWRPGMSPCPSTVPQAVRE
eukprot:7988837-Karenia_brevis.AAC.1